MKIFLIFLILLSSCATPKYFYADLSDEEKFEARRELTLSKLETRSAREIDEKTEMRRLEKIYSSLYPHAKSVCSRLNESSNCYRWAIEYSDEDVINAYQSGIGVDQKITFTKGILSIAKNDDELALVMAHEIAHAVLNHISEDQGNRTGGEILGSILGAFLGGALAVAMEDPYLVDPLVDGFADTGEILGGEIGQMRYSSRQELEADRIGLEIFLMSGFNFIKGKELIKYITNDDAQSFETPYLTSHPVGIERLAHLNKSYKEEVPYLAQEQNKKDNELIQNIKNNSNLDCSSFVENRDLLYKCLTAD
jgi:Zn-dependent protease with chaperone function